MFDNTILFRRLIMNDMEKLITEMHQCLMDPQFGLRTMVKELKGAIDGNGKVGLKTQVRILWIAVAGMVSTSIGILVKSWNQ